MEVWPSLITPTTGTPTASTASRSSTARSWARPESRLRASTMMPDRQSRITHSTADIRLQAIERQNDPALRGQTSPQGLALHQPGGQQFIVAVEQVGDAALGNGDAARREHRMDLGHAAMVAV